MPPWKREIPMPSAIKNFRTGSGARMMPIIQTVSGWRIIFCTGKQGRRMWSPGCFRKSWKTGSAILSRGSGARSGFWQDCCKSTTRIISMTNCSGGQKTQILTAPAVMMRRMWWMTTLRRMIFWTAFICAGSWNTEMSWALWWMSGKTGRGERRTGKLPGGACWQASTLIWGEKRKMRSSIGNSLRKLLRQAVAGQRRSSRLTGIWSIIICGWKMRSGRLIIAGWS